MGGDVVATGNANPFGSVIVFAALVGVFVIMTVVGLFAMWSDKKKAKKGKWRTKEATLFAIAFFMGGVGTTAGMYKFRHKTQHWYFKYGMPALAILNILTLIAAGVMAFR